MVMGESANLLGSAQIGLFDEDKEDSIFHALEKCGYDIRFKVLNAHDYGVPQSRERVIFIGVKKEYKIPISYPPRTSLQTSVYDAIHDLIPDDFRATSPTVTRVFEFLNYGETTYSYGQRANDKMGGTQRHKSFKHRPCRTVTTSPEIFHYDEMRTMAINELTRICSFPSDYYLGDKFYKKWERLGRAVPPLMMKAVAEHVYKTILQKI
jgi:DNA (cytosine-5)-methyltransferase 1